MNIDFESALSILKEDPTDLISWSIILDAMNNRVSTSRTINGKLLSSNIILGLASSDFANQGTTTTILHGNASGNPSWGALVTGDITDANITLPKIQDISTSRILGRITGGSGTIEQLTGTQLTSLLDVFATDATTKGLVPGSNSVGNTYFLRADGTWAIPSASASLAHNDTTGKQGGTSGEYYHLTAAKNTLLTGSNIVNLTTDVAEDIVTGLTCSSTGISTGSDGSQSAYVVLTWDVISTTTFRNYIIRYKKASYTYYTYIDSSINTITIEGLTPNISYNFGVASVNKYGTISNYCSNITQTTASDTVPPTTVSILSATAGILSVVVDWTANTESDLAYYNVYRYTSDDSGSSVLIAQTRTDFYIDTRLTAGQPYYYWLKAVDTSGNESTSFSTEVHATPHKIVNAETDVGHQGWVQTCAFATPDIDTVTWGAGTFTSASGDAYSIDAGTTGNMTVPTYIYLDTLVAPTIYQITTTATSAIGDGKVLVAIADLGIGASSTESTYMLLNNTSYNLNAANIVAGSITANEIATTTITASNIDTSTITNLSSLVIGAPQVLLDGATTFLNTWMSYKGIYDAGTTYNIGDQVGYPTASTLWNYKNVTPAAGHIPAEDVWWTTAGSQKTTIDGGIITASTINTTQLNFTAVTDGNVIGSINASSEGIEIDADNFTVTGATVFTKKVGGTYSSTTSGARVLIFPDANTGIQVIDDTPADVFKVIIGGTDIGDVIFGNYTGDQGIKYDKSENKTIFKGSIGALSGTFGGWNIDADSIYSGTKETDPGYSASAGDMTIRSDGSIHANKFFINATGEVSFAASGSSISTIATLSGDLVGNVNTTQAASAATPDVWELEFVSGIGGTCDIEIDSTTQTATWGGSLTQTAINFAGAASYPDIIVANPSGAVITFTKASGEIGYVTPTDYGIDGDNAHQTGFYAVALPQIDEVTITGNSGECTLDSNGALGVVHYNFALLSGIALTLTCEDFVTNNNAEFTANDITLSSVDNVIKLTRITTGSANSPVTTSNNIPRSDIGDLTLIGNEIFNADENSDEGAILINHRGYNGGTSKYRNLYIEDGKGSTIIRIDGSAGYTYITMPDAAGGTKTGYLRYNSGNVELI